MTTVIQKIRHWQNLEATVSADGFENIGTCVVLFFVKNCGKRNHANATRNCHSAREVRETLKDMKAEGWTCWGRMFGDLHMSA